METKERCAHHASGNRRVFSKQPLQVVLDRRDDPVRPVARQNVARHQIVGPIGQMRSVLEVWRIWRCMRAMARVFQLVEIYLAELPQVLSILPLRIQDEAAANL